jgi:imidazolonepropionase-like amidohydrolase
MRIVNIGVLIDGTGALAARDQAIIVKDSRITWIGPQEQLPPPSPDTTQVVLDAQGGTVLPGFIDAHVHLQSPSAGSDPPDTAGGLFSHKYFDPVGITVLRIARNAQLALVAGITTVRDCGSRDGLARQVRDAINQDLLTGPRILAAGQVITTTAGHCYLMGHEADTADEMRKGIRTEVKAGSDFIKIMATGGFGTPGSSPRQPQYSAKELQAAVEDAHRLGKKVAAHVYGVAGIRNCVEAGTDSLEHCAWLTDEDTSYGTGFDAGIVAEMAAKGLFIATHLGTGERVKRRRAQSRGEAAYKRYLHERSVHCENVKKMLATGVKLCVGTDAGAGLNWRVDAIASNVPDFVEFLGLTPMEAILTLTKNPAEMIGIIDRVGTLELGKEADLAIIDGDPLLDPQVLDQVRVVVRNGKLVARDGQTIAPTRLV